MTEEIPIGPTIHLPTQLQVASLQPPQKSVYQAIAKVQAALAKEGIAKERNNQQQGFKFRGIDDIYNALASHLAENNLCILPRIKSRGVTERTNKNGTALFYIVIEADFDFVSAVDGSTHTVTVFGEAMDSGDKATNKAMSAAYKYACMQSFCIPTEGDNDADATTHEVKGKSKPVFTNAALRKTFCENVITSFAEAASLPELEELAKLNKDRFVEMDGSDNEHDKLAVDELRKRYVAAVARIKAADNQKQNIVDSHGSGFAATVEDYLGV